ncbi:sentrin-specific protease 2-like [Acomys russatus]|uniref:sentrin-specific protease 2-like n=1 Tax=Acomys russatus TaxID=60746 RepID=UPI0021E253ED|nr:sentrin-specific protease 2-like [Acomys russatus]
MSNVQETSSSEFSDPSTIKRTTNQEPPPRFWLMCTLKTCITMDSRHLSEGNPRLTGPPPKLHGTRSHDHPGNCQKRKYKEEGGDDAQSEEPAELRKKQKPEQGGTELGCEEPAKGQMWKAHDEGQVQLKSPECNEGPEDEAVIEVKSADGSKGCKCPNCSRGEGVQKRHNKKCPRLLGNLQHDDPVSSGPHSAHTSPADTSEKIEDCVDGQIHESETPQICTDSVSNGILSNKKSIPEAKEKALAAQAKGRGLVHGPDVTADMEKEISSALGPGSPDEILSCAFKLQITRGDMRTLKGTRWLNDKIINFYMNLLVERNKKQGYPSVHAFNTFFYTKLKCGGYRSVRRWTQAVNLFAKELILVPIHLNVHWSLVVIDLRKKSIVYLDSMGQRRPDILELIFRYLQHESQSRRNVDLNPLEWKRYSMTEEEIPQQANGGDCGMFTCKYADYVSRGQPITFSQQHVPLFRKMMVWEILHQHVL